MLRAKLTGNHTSSRMAFRVIKMVGGSVAPLDCYVYWPQITLKFTADAVNLPLKPGVYLSDGSRHRIERDDTSHARRGYPHQTATLLLANLRIWFLLIGHRYFGFCWRRRVMLTWRRR